MEFFKCSDLMLTVRGACGNRKILKISIFCLLTISLLLHVSPYEDEVEVPLSTIDIKVKFLPLSTSKPAKKRIEIMPNKQTRVIEELPSHTEASLSPILWNVLSTRSKAGGG